MTKEEIIQKLQKNHSQFTKYIFSLRSEDFKFSMNNEKWTAGQQAGHIYLSIKPLNAILSYPKWLAKMMLKKANRPSKSYEGLVKKYHEKLSTGRKAPQRFVMEAVTEDGKNELLKKIEKSVLKLCAIIKNYSEQELDSVVLPHPLLGYLTLREMMYFTIYHVEHHHKITERNLQERLVVKS